MKKYLLIIFLILVAFLNMGNVNAAGDDTVKIKVFLYKVNSPIKHTVPQLVYNANKYGIDPKIMVAIAGTESNFGKNMCSNDPTTRNPYGLKVDGICMRFSSIQAANAYFAQLLGGKYKGGAMVVIAKIGKEYHHDTRWISLTRSYHRQINHIK